MKDYLTYKKRWMFYIVFTLIYFGMSAMLYFIPQGTGALILSMVAVGAIALFAYTILYKRFDLWPILYSFVLLVLVSVPGLIYSFGVESDQPFTMLYILMVFHACLQALVIIIAAFFVKVGKNIEKARKNP